MAKKKPPQVQYISATPQRTPQQEATDAQFNQNAQSQLAALQASYQKQLEGLNQQFTANQGQAASTIDTLNASLRAQQEAAAQSRMQAEEAKKASDAQLSLLSAQRDGSAAQMGDRLSQQTAQSSSLFARLQRRRQARQVKY